MTSKENYICFHVTDSPRATIYTPVIDETQPGQLSCIVSSKPESTISLYRLVDNVERLISGTTTNNNTLNYVMITASRDDAGTYMCKANNGIGYDSNVTDVNVRCKYML